MYFLLILKFSEHVGAIYYFSFFSIENNVSNLVFYISLNIKGIFQFIQLFTKGTKIKHPKSLHIILFIFFFFSLNGKYNFIYL